MSYSIIFRFIGIFVGGILLIIPDPPTQLAGLGILYFSVTGAHRKT